MRKLTIVLFSILSFVVGRSQTTIDFHVSFQPNSVYRLATEQSSRIEIESQKKNQAANQSGAENQSVTETTSKHLSSITTGPMKPDQSFSWKMVFDSISSTKAVNQKPATVKNFIEGLAVEGTYDKTNRLHIDSVTLNTIDENIRAEIKAAAENMLGQSGFPSAHMKIGDEIIHQTPFKWPTRNSGSIEFHLKTAFKLVDIKDDIAFFELTQQMDSIHSEGNYMKGIGQGTGKCEYNIRKHFIAKYQTNSTTDISMNVFGEKVKGKINSTYFQQTTFNDKK